MVATLMSMLLATLTTVAIRLRQWDRQMRDNGVHGDQVAALADSLRADASGGTELKLLSKDTLVIENTDKHEICYTLQSDGCRRDVKSSKNASRSTTTFTIGPFEAWKVESGPTGRRAAYTVSLARPDSEKATARVVPLFVYAVLNTAQSK